MSTAMDSSLPRRRRRPDRMPGCFWTVRRLLSAGLLMAVTALLVVSGISYSQIGRLSRDREPVQHAYQVIDEISDLNGRLEDAETGQRGFLITGRESYLAPYRLALPAIKDSIAALAEMTAGDPRQHATVEQLAAPVKDKLAELAQTIELRRTGSFAAAQMVVLSGRGAGDMTTIRALLQRMQQHEDAVLATRLQAADRHSHQTRLLIALGSLLALLFVGVGAWAIAEQVLGPVSRVTAAARRISSGNLSEPAEVSGPRELAEMAAAVNASVEVISRARDEALDADAAKSAFLATMSHEIRTPMNAVIGMTELLLTTELGASQREYTEIVRDSGDALLAIINDILDYTKMESGELALDDHPFEVRECVEGALAQVALAAQAKGISLVSDLSSGCPRLFRGDPYRLRQVLVHLLGNAVKFTARGKVTVSLTCTALSDRLDGPTLLRVDVSDTGIGIPANRTEGLFASFSQADSSSTREYGGTGLGLTISRRLARAMGGDLVVTSEEGAGSTFTLTAALLGHPDQRDPARQPSALLSGLIALVVDDSETNRRVLRMQLQGWGVSCREFGSPVDALNWVATGQRFDLAVLDMHMPGMNGAQLGEALHRLPVAHGIPLVLLSSVSSLLEPGQRSEFAAVLQKPVRSAVLESELLSVLRPVESTLLSVERSGGQREQDPPRADDVSLRILLAEDNPTNQKVAQLLLAKLGHRVDTVDNGLKAVAAMRRTAYDVVLMDLQMPEMDGLQATQQIRAELPRERQPRIVAVTASALIEDRAACRRAGMDAYLAKPVRQQELADTLASVLHRRTAEQVDYATIGEDGGPAPAGATAGLPDPQPDRAEAIRLRLADLRDPDSADDDGLIGQLLRSFVERAPATLDLLEISLGQDDAADVEFLAHSLKGSALNIGADRLGQLCQALEAQGRAGDLQATSQVLAQTRDELTAVSGAIVTVASELEAGP